MKPPLPYIAIGLVIALGFATTHPHVHHLLAFLGGVLASVLIRIVVFRELAAKRISSLLIIGCLLIAVIACPSGYGSMPLLLLTLTFSLIAGGNSLFGILTNGISRTLGETAYSIYLLHGIALFILFTFVIGRDDAKNLSPAYHWLLVISITPLLILGCYFTYRFIERPFMQRTNTVTIWLRSHLTLRSSRTLRDKDAQRP